MEAGALISELKRRRVIRALVGYGIAAFAVLQIIEPVMHGLHWPDEVLSYVVVALAAGFPVVVSLAWIFDVNEGRIERAAPAAGSLKGIRLGLLLVGMGLLAATPGLAWYFFRARAASTKIVSTEAGAPTGTAPRSVAVLPLVSLSTEPDNEFFADGLSEEILNSLARISGLQVVARTSSFRFKGKTVDLREAGSALGVGAILEGSVRRNGPRARITAQLVRVADGFHLWSQTYDRTLTDTLAIQLDIAEHVAAALDVLLDDAQRERLKRFGLKNVEAYVAFQKGYRLFTDAHQLKHHQSQIEMLRRANQLFADAVALEPEFADAHYRASDLHAHLLLSDGTSAGERNSALAMVRREYSFAIHQSHDPFEALGFEIEAQLFSDDWHGLREKYQQWAAMQGCAEVGWNVNFALAMGLAQQIEAMARRLAACDPLNFTNRARLFLEVANATGHPERALQLGTEATRGVGPLLYTTTLEVRALVALGRFDEARNKLATADEGEPLAAAASLVIAAAAGETGSDLRVRTAKFRRGLSSQDTWSWVDWLASVLGGDRADANRRSAVFDGRPAGPLMLGLLAGLCECGAPFDLDATPNFKQRITESGLAWPPPSPIHFPHRDRQ